MLGYGSALEALKSRRGDCTEYAVLLAAMGRAAGIPTRVVSGLVYARNFEGQNYVFVPHVWVHAWTGAGWESFDAALGRFDSTHLAFATSDDGNPVELFAGMNLAHELRLTSAARPGWTLTCGDSDVPTVHGHLADVDDEADRRRVRTPRVDPHSVERYRHSPGVEVGGSATQLEAASQVLAQARRSLYLILAGESEEDAGE